MHLRRFFSNSSRLPMFLTLRQNPHVLLTSGKVQNPLCLPHETTSERPKVARNCQTWKCASPRATTACTFSSSQLPKGLHFFVGNCFPFFFGFFPVFWGLMVFIGTCSVLQLSSLICMLLFFFCGLVGWFVCLFDCLIV